MQYNIDTGIFQVVLESADINAVVGESARIEVGEAINYIKTGQTEIGEAVQEGIASFDSNAGEKTSEFNTNAANKKSDFNNNALAKTSAYNDNADNRLSEYNSNADNKLEAYNNNDSAKTSAYNSNASEKVSAYNANDIAKTQAYNNNATAKTADFNTNSSDKTSDFNTNYSTKKALIDAKATESANSADLAKQWAIGEPSEPSGNSSKYWAGQAQAELSGLTSRVSTIEGKIPSSAGSSNKLTDKSYVDMQDNNLQSQIDAIVASSDVFDIVGTYAELQAYDISSVPVNDIIKVLVDSTHANAATYYRCIETAGVKSWSYIGAEGAFYTKGEANALLATKQDTLVSGTNIKTVNGSSILGSGNLTTSAQWGGITGTLSNQTDLQNALNAKSNNSDVVKLTGNQTIEGVKTFSSSLVLPTPATSDNSTKGATTAFVKAQGYTSNVGTITGIKMNGASKGTSGVVDLGTVLTAHQSLANYVTLNSTQTISGTKTFSSSPVLPTPAASDNSTKGATTAFVKAQGYVGSSSLTAVHVVTQTYVNGTSWYRVWSDGWIEQGGKGSFSPDGTVITFLKSYTNTNYSILATADRSSSGSRTDGVGLMVLSRSTTNFALANKNYGTSLTVDGYWYACGY